MSKVHALVDTLLDGAPSLTAPDRERLRSRILLLLEDRALTGAGNGWTAALEFLTRSGQVEASRLLLAHVQGVILPELAALTGLRQGQAN